MSATEYAGIRIDGSATSTKALVDRLRAARVQLAERTGVVPDEDDDGEEPEGVFTSDPPSDPIG